MLAVSVVLVDPAMSQLFFLVDDVASVNLIRKEREDSRILVSLRRRIMAAGLE